MGTSLVHQPQSQERRFQVRPVSRAKHRNGDDSVVQKPGGAFGILDVSAPQEKISLEDCFVRCGLGRSSTGDPIRSIRFFTLTLISRRRNVRRNGPFWPPPICSVRNKAMWSREAVEANRCFDGLVVGPGVVPIPIPGGNNPHGYQAFLSSLVIPFGP
jgi:hypothetical protein